MHMKASIGYGKKDAQTRGRHTLPSLLFTSAVIAAMLVCYICDKAISGTLTWSLFPLSSLLLLWSAAIPVIHLGKQGVRPAMVIFSLLIVPFMYVLRLLTGVSEVFRIGAVMSLFALVFLWGTYALYTRFSGRKRYATGILCLLSIPFLFLINATLSLMLGEAPEFVWDILTAIALLFTGCSLIRGARVRETREEYNEAT